MYYERRKQSGELPIVGVNTFLSSTPEETREIELRRSNSEQKDAQIASLRDFQKRHQAETPAALDKLRSVALSDGNIFEELMKCVACASLGQISACLYSVGGQYRRNM